ncbi:MAG TPA: GMC family oxidoreductase [Chloroflexota bacterium]|nr:GMC family oxidoreductase [Chloroflexota bacterium]
MVILERLQPGLDTAVARTELTPREQHTLALLYDTLIARHTPAPGDDPKVMQTSASDVSLMLHALVVINKMEPDERAAVRLFLKLLETPIVNLALGRIPRRFSAMTPQEREVYLQRLITSPVSAIALGLGGLKRLGTLMFYSLPSPDGPNPVWPVIGYQAPTAPPQTDRVLTLTPITGATTLEADVCIIGSGAGGGVVAAEASAAGKRVLVLEAGPGLQAGDYPHSELLAVRDMYLILSSKDRSMAIIAGHTLGGATAINWQMSFRPPDRVREEWARHTGMSLFTDSSFDRSLDVVTSRVNVTPDESVVNANNAVITRGAQALGYKLGTIHRNARACDPDQCGFCVLGCRHGGKQSTLVTFLHDAQSAGRETQIVAHCQADRLVIENGRATALEATVTDPETGAAHAVRVRARTFVVSCGAINSPPLLLRSGLTHPAIGGSIFLHPSTWVIGFYPDHIGSWEGPPNSVYSDQFATLEGNYGFMLESIPAHPGSIAFTLPWFSSQHHRRLMQSAGHMATMLVLGRDQQGGRVRASRAGQPVIEYRAGALEQRLLQRGIVEGTRVHLAAGAEKVLTLHTDRLGQFERQASTTPADIDAFCADVGRRPLTGRHSLLFSAHQMGSLPLGTDPQRSACDPEGRLRGVANVFVADSSIFPGASGVNPMITTMGLAHHVSKGIVAES